MIPTMCSRRGLTSSDHYAFDLGPVRRLKKPVTLASIKSSGKFETFPLVRMSRLSVMPVTDAEWSAIEKMSEAE